MKKLLAGFLTLCMVLGCVQSIPAMAKKKADFLYVVDGKYVTLTKYQGKSKNVVIPEKVDGKKVDCIGKTCFAQNKKVTSITINAKYLEIEDDAMVTCKKLKTLTIGPKVAELDLDAYLGCKALKTIKVDKKNKNMADFHGALYNKDLTTLSYVPAKCTTKFISKKLESIGYHACSEMTVKSFTIPETVTSMNEESFVGNDSLTQLTVSRKMNYFNPKIIKDCAALSTVIIEDGNAKFTTVDGCVYNKVVGTLLAVPPAKGGDLVVPTTVNLIDDEAVANCQLNSVTLPDSVTTIGKATFCNSTIGQITVSPNLQVMGSKAFSGSRVASLDISKTKITEIPDSCFSESYIGGIVFPAGLKKVDALAFSRCPQLTTIAFPEGMEELGRDACANCKNLSTVSIPATLSRVMVGTKQTLDAVKLTDRFDDYSDDWYEDEEEVEDYSDYYDEEYDEYYDDYIDNTNPFVGCNNLKAIDVAKDNTVYSSENGVWYNKEKSVLYCVPALFEGTYTVPGTLKTIYNSAFAFVKNISSVVIPDTVEYIGAGAFANSSLSTVYLPSKIHYIRDYTFSNTKVTDIVVPDQVDYIGLGAFCNCSELTSISLPVSLENMCCYGYDSDTFSICNNCPKLASITVDRMNENYKSQDGILFSIGGNDTLLCYPSAKKGKNYSVPKKCQIGEGAFNSCKFLKKVTIPEGIKTLENGFINCKSLTIVAPKSLKKFGSVDVVKSKYGFMMNCKKVTIKASKGSKISAFCKKYGIKCKEGK